MSLLIKAKPYLFILIWLLVGVVIGGYLFSDTRPRSFLALDKCEDTCLQPKDVIGLLVSVGIQKFPSVIPSVITETEKTIVVKHPLPEARIHYLIFPKKDIRNITDVSESDGQYLTDAFRVIAEVVKGKHLVRYRVLTNGPGYQEATYLHFHLIAE